MTSAPVHPDPAIADQLAAFAALVRASPHNLVSRRAREELMERHIPECVTFAGMLPQEQSRLLDLGSGGGFPGMVIALCRPDLEVHLLDATAKKTGFLQEAARALGVSVQVHTGRAEDLARARDLRGGFDVVTARAVAPLQRLVGWATPFLRTRGLLYAMKGERWQDELDAAHEAIERAGASVVATPEDVHGDVDGEDPWAPRVVIVARVR